MKSQSQRNTKKMNFGAFWNLVISEKVFSAELPTSKNGAQNANQLRFAYRLDLQNHEII